MFCLTVDTTMPRIPGHLQPRKNWPTWASNVLITHPIVRIWPRRTSPVPWTEKTIEKSLFFVRHEVIATVETWLDGQCYDFFSGLHKLEQRAKKCIEFHGEFVIKIPSLVAVDCFVPGRAKDVLAPSRILYL
jgi:hypothetical protein